MNLKGAIFDLDGTLLDSMFIWDTIGADYLISRGITPEEGLNEKFKSLSIIQAAEYYRSNYGLIDSVEEIVDGVNKMIEHYYFDVVNTKTGVKKLLERFSNQGVKMCVATATDKYMAEAALKRNGIYYYFSGILTCTEVGAGKDSPKIFEKAIELLEIKKEESIVFEDAIYAIETAKSAGFYVVGIEDKSSKIDKEKIKESCDNYIEKYEDWSDSSL